MVFQLLFSISCKIEVKERELRVKVIGRGVAWLDTGTHEALHDAAAFISTLEKRQGLKFGCPEEVAFKMGYIDESKLDKIVESIPNSPYRDYLKMISNEKIKTWEIAI